MSQSILIVDDATFIREALIHICSDLGLIVCGEAKNGQQAIVMAEQLRPDYIIMDMVMPEMNGLEAVEKILELIPKTKIIACSTVDQQFMMQKALQIGCVAYLAKPFNKRSIQEAINSVRSMSRISGGHNV